MAFDEFLFAGKELHFDLRMPVMPEEFMSSQQKPLAVHEGCGFHAGQIPRDLLQQAVDILAVRGEETWEGW